MDFKKLLSQINLTLIIDFLSLPDIDECVVEPDRCLFLEGGKCQNSVGGASCECNTGYHSQPNPEYRVNSSIPREKCVGK